MTGTIIAIIVAGVIGAFAFYLMEQNEDLMKKNIELMKKDSEKLNGMIRFKRKAYLLTADRYDDNTLNSIIEKKQNEGWEFGGVSGGFVILWLSEEIKEG